MSGRAGEYEIMLKNLLAEFNQAMDDDFNTALAISHMFTLAKEINKYKQDNDLVDGKIVDLFNHAWHKMTEVIGVLEDESVKAQASEDTAALTQVVEGLIAVRQKAKTEKNYALADALRNGLTAAGIVLEDTRDGVRWKKA